MNPTLNCGDLGQISQYAPFSMARIGPPHNHLDATLKKNQVDLSSRKNAVKNRKMSEYVPYLNHLKSKGARRPF